MSWKLQDGVKPPTSWLNRSDNLHSRNERQITAIPWPDSFPTKLETCTETTRTIKFRFHSFGVQSLRSDRVSCKNARRCLQKWSNVDLPHNSVLMLRAVYCTEASAIRWKQKKIRKKFFFAGEPKPSRPLRHMRSGSVGNVVVNSHLLSGQQTPFKRKKLVFISGSSSRQWIPWSSFRNFSIVSVACIIVNAFHGIFSVFLDIIFVIFSFFLYSLLLAKVWSLLCLLTYCSKLPYS